MNTQREQGKQSLLSPDGESNNPSIANVLRVRPFLFLWTSQILSQIAFNMLSFTLVLHVYELTRSNIAVSALVLFFLTPQLVLSLFAGVFVDRFEKKGVLIFTNIFRMFSLLPLVVLESQVVALYGGALLVATATQFFIPAEAPMIPKLVVKKLLLPANSLFTVTLYGSIIMGYILAGPFLKYFGITTTFFTMAILFGIASICNMLLPGGNSTAMLKRHIKTLSEATYTKVLHVLFNDIGEMLFAVIRTKAVLTALVYLTVSQAVITIVGALVPGYAATVLGIDIEDSSLILLGPAAIGMIFGSMTVVHLGLFVDKGRIIGSATLLSGIMLTFLSFFSRITNANILLAVLAVCFFLGLFNSMIVVPANTIIQEKSQISVRGRIYGFFNMLSALASIVPVLLAGYFSDVIGVAPVLTTIGIAILLFGILHVVKRL